MNQRQLPQANRPIGEERQEGTMNARTLLLAVGIVLLAGLTQAGELAVPRAVIGTAVEDREPVGVAEQFSAEVGTVLCFTEVTGAGDASQVAHVWYLGDEEQARITLPVRGERWRTWSQKRIGAGQVGTWRVEVEGPDGGVLAKVLFTVTE